MSDPSAPPKPPAKPQDAIDGTCPVCGAALRQQQCKVFCSRCHHLVFNCSEF